MRDQPEARFNAPWGRMLTLITSASVAILVCMPIIGLMYNPGDTGVWFLES